ncbi:hypothetical protein KNE206_75990 [Kitasatospora sp. NE20-6]|uniref:hypothetical protein n=1 Tax=Kitasatospora sp. NE20-6 TaxID=2859066 RepID=UPI0034DC3975
MTASALAGDHLSLLETAQPLCLRHALALAGPDALAAHGLRATRSTGLVLVTAENPPLADIATGLVEHLRAAGHRAGIATGTPRQIQLTGTPCPVELRKEPLRHPVLLLPGVPVPVVALPDAAALTVLRLCDRALPEDLAALHVLAGRFPEGELVALARAFDEDFQPGALADRLEAAAELVHPDAAARSAWAHAWAQDLRLDLLETQEAADGLHDPYLEAVEAEQSDDL